MSRASCHTSGRLLSTGAMDQALGLAVASALTASAVAVDNVHPGCPWPVL